jgi:putative ABC transport system substrate-binding protein
MGINSIKKYVWLTIFAHVMIAVLCNAVFASKIGVIMTGDIQYYQDIHNAFLKNFKHEHEIVIQRPMPNPMSWTNAARKLVNIGSDMIIGYGTPATLTTMKVTSDIPIVFAGVYDPKAMKIGGKNATGVSSTVSVKEILKTLKILSKGSKLGVILGKSEKDTILQTRQIKKDAASVGFESVLFAIKSSVDKNKIKGVDAILLTSCSAAMLQIKDIVDIARRDKIPLVAMIGGGENAGVLITVSADPKEQGEKLAVAVNKILEGTNVSAIAIEEPKQIQTTINLKEAQTIGLNIPAGIKNSATNFIE